jgi:hypothetical protein
MGTRSLTYVFSERGDEDTEEDEDLRTSLGKGEVHVHFTKADGSKRKMHCTTNPKLIPADKAPHTTKTNLDPNLFKVFDLDLGEWRSFRNERVISWMTVK